MKKLIAHSGLGLNELNSLFFDISTLNREEFRYSEIHTKMLGKLGVKYEQKYYIPQTWFVFENIFKGTSNNYQLIHLKMKLEKNTEN